VRSVTLGILIAVVFWFVMFSPWTKDSVNFWFTMIAATSVLTALSLIAGRKELNEVYKFKYSHMAIGLISAAVLYFVFFLGNSISNILFDFSREQVSNIYSTKEQADKIFIGLALLFWIGPAEEIFWRGFVQHRLMNKFGAIRGMLITTAIYALVHIWAFNFILFMAALICGLFWGWMYFKYKSLVPAIISHAVWDAFIFVVLPISV